MEINKIIQADQNVDIPVIDSIIDNDEILYSKKKDFYIGLQGELRFKAEGLFKKAKEKGISIEEIEVTTLRENSVDFPGIGMVDLPMFIAKIRGKLLSNGQIITDGKQIDYYNRYQKYVARKIEQKNLIRNPNGKPIWEDGKPKVKSPPDLALTEWERFEIGKALIEDKEFGLEKTITGACDRVIRKLMGENDWLYPGETGLLDEEFNDVQEKIKQNTGQTKIQTKIQAKNQAPEVSIRKASDKQINFFKSKIKNSGLDMDDEKVAQQVMNELGFSNQKLEDLSITDMSKVIDNIYIVVQKVKEKSLPS